MKHELITEVERPIPVVFGGENGALPIVRSLAKIGLQSIVVSERIDDITFKSRYCAEAVVLKRFEPGNDKHNVETLVHISRRFPTRPVLLWSSDPETLFINRNQEELDRWFRFVMCEPSLTDQLVDKAQFALLATERGLPAPRTLAFYSRQEIEQNITSIPLPCIIKPVHMKDWYTPGMKAKYGSYKHALHRLATPEQVKEYIKDLPHAEHGLIVQEFIEGRDEGVCSFHAYFNDAGELIAAFLGRKIRTNPIHFGGSAYVETIHDPELLKLGLDICKEIGFRGIVKIDFKKNTLNNKYYVLEFNPRFTLWNYLGAFAGINIPVIWYNDLSGNSVTPTMSYESGRRWLAFASDLRALPAYIRAHEWSLGQWLKSYLAPKVYHTFAWDDPWPIAFSFTRFVRRKVAWWKLRRSLHRAA